MTHTKFTETKPGLGVTVLHKESESLLSVTFVMSYLLIFLPIFRYNSLKTTAFWIARQASIVYFRFSRQYFHILSHKISDNIHIFPNRHGDMLEDYWKGISNTHLLHELMTKNKQ